MILVESSISVRFVSGPHGGAEMTVPLGEVPRVQRPPNGHEYLLSGRAGADGVNLYV